MGWLLWVSTNRGEPWGWVRYNKGLYKWFCGGVKGCQKSEGTWGPEKVLVSSRILGSGGALPSRQIRLTVYILVGCRSVPGTSSETNGVFSAGTEPSKARNIYLSIYEASNRIPSVTCAQKTTIFFSFHPKSKVNHFNPCRVPKKLVVLLLNNYLCVCSTFLYM